MRVVVDAYGGDNAPLEIVKGAALASNEYGVDITLTGNKTEIDDISAEIGTKNVEYVNKSAQKAVFSTTSCAFFI